MIDVRDVLSSLDWLFFVLIFAAIYSVADRWVGYPFPLHARILVPLFGLPSYFASTREFGVWGERALWTFGILSGLVGIGIHRAAKEDAQRKRDETSLAVLKALRSSTPLPVKRFAVYARPFNSTDQLTTQNMDLAWIPGQTPTHIDLETKLTRALQGRLHTVALGRPGEMMGSGRIDVAESEWQSAFVLLASNAALVLLLPSSRAGTHWETEWLLKNARDRLLLIMPMSPTPSQSYRGEWEKAGVTLSQIGVELPPYDDRGAIFRINSEGKPIAITRLPRWSSIPALQRTLMAAAPPELKVAGSSMGGV